MLREGLPAFMSRSFRVPLQGLTRWLFRSAGAILLSGEDINHGGDDLDCG